MNCNNCTNNNALKEVKIKHVHGNVLRMAIPLTLRTIELVDGEINATDTPFVPSSEHPVKVVFSKGSVSVAIDATMKDGNIAYVEEKGKIPVGTYAITVTCNDDNGNPYRFKQNAVLYVADATIEAGIEETIEYEVTTWYLDAAIFLALKGEDGVGIYDIETQSSGEIGGVNTVTFILTDGRTRSFNILNGSGAVDSDLDINSQSPIANSAVTAKFNELSGELADLFGDVDYDTSNKSIRFWDKGKTNVLASLDARPFIKDGMVSNAYISNNTLVITFNTDSGKEAIGVPLTSAFNPNNYYTKTQVDSRIASAVANINLSNYYTKAQVDNKLIGLMAKEDFVYEGSVNLKYGSAPEIVLSHIDGVSMYQEDHSRLFGTSNGHIKGYVGATGSQLFDYGLAPNGLVFLDKTSGLFYRWDYTTWQQVGGSSGGYEPPIGGIPKSDLAQSVQDTLDDVSNKVDKVAGKGLSTEDYTTAEKQKLAGLSNYDDTEIQAEVDAKYEKPSTGIPKTDLASGVQTSLGKADTALQSSDLDGYATTDDVDDAVAALVSSAPQTLDTLKELADALGDDPNFATTMATQLGNKVDKETGKGLSTNDYTTDEKTKLAGLENYDDSSLQTAIAGKVDKESGKSLMTDAERTKLQGIAAGAEVNVQPNWTQTNTSADDYIKNKPTLATVATSGSYNDLEDKPNIPAGVTVDQTITQNGTNPVRGSAIYSALQGKEDRHIILNLEEDANDNLVFTDLDGNTIAHTQVLGWLQNKSASVMIDYDGAMYEMETGGEDFWRGIYNTGDYYAYINFQGADYPITTLEFEDKDEKIYLASQNWVQSRCVPQNRKINNKPLSSDITLNASDVGALPASTTIPSKTSDLTNDSGFIDKAMYYGTSDTAAATMPKVCTVETFPTTTSGNVTHAKEGTIIAVKFTNSDTNTTDAPSLNVNGIGAKAIMYNNAIVTSTAKNTTVAGTAKMLAYYRYDPALDEGNGAWEFLAKSVDSNSTYSNASLGQGYGTQTNSSAATAITSSISSYALSSGGIVTIKFTYDVPANATLNINSKGAKAIYNQGAAITAGVIKAGDTATFIYSTYYHLIAVDSWQEKQDTISDLATIRSGAAAGATAAQPADLPTKVSDLTNDSGFTSNAGTITGITMNGASKGTSGVVDLGTVITAHQDISGKANASDVYTKTQADTLLAGKQNTLTFDSTPTASSTNPVTSGGVKTYVDGKATITGITTSQDGTFTITLSDGNSYIVNLNHVHPQYLKYELLADEAAYTALSTKDSSTLYLIPETT